jgi:anti-sigma regulatory factor (Ser/Thr protein kinase)
LNADSSSDADDLVHHAMVYSSTDDFLAGTVPFVQRGVERGDAVVAVTGHAAELTDALGDDSGEVEVVDQAEWHRVPAWTIASYAKRAQRSALRGAKLRAVSEHTWEGRTADETADWFRYESLLNYALGGTGAEMLCAFDERTGEHVVQMAGSTHPMMRNAGVAKESAEYLDPASYAASYPPPVGPPPPADALTMRFGEAEIPAVRRAALRWAREAGLDPDRASELLIAVYEVASNAVEHGGGVGVGRFWTADRRLLCEVSSARPIDDPLAGYRPPSTTQERGRGLWLARQICERVDIRSGADGATVRLSSLMD